VVCVAVALLLAVAAFVPLWSARLFPALLDWVLAAPSSSCSAKGEAPAAPGPSERRRRPGAGAKRAAE
jgi:hypothetical protein